MPESGACEPKTIGAHSDRPRISFSSAELHLPVARPTEVRPEVRRPEPALLDDLLQRRDERLAHRVVEVVRLLDDQVERLALLAHEGLDPRQLLGVLGISREVPRHRSPLHALGFVRRRLCYGFGNEANPGGRRIHELGSHVRRAGLHRHRRGPRPGTRVRAVPRPPRRQGRGQRPRRQPRRHRRRRRTRAGGRRRDHGRGRRGRRQHRRHQLLGRRRQPRPAGDRHLRRPRRARQQRRHPARPDAVLDDRGGVGRA